MQKQFLHAKQSTPNKQGQKLRVFEIQNFFQVRYSTKTATYLLINSYNQTLTTPNTTTIQIFILFQLKQIFLSTKLKKQVTNYTIKNLQNQVIIFKTKYHIHYFQFLYYYMIADIFTTYQNETLVQQFYNKQHQQKQLIKMLLITISILFKFNQQFNMYNQITSNNKQFNVVSKSTANQTKATPKKYTIKFCSKHSYATNTETIHNIS
eukprot:TRINITY_DN28634_c0_g2_i1.p2 TRINITY_DN28634_c0_g2~~TRINITY_DN28634_c0_g2_i1.p2  ORF type:complete len:208 (-),score=-13.13 TRINITY_DN28634_c0_g2_i1:164-787(-)